MEKIATDNAAKEYWSNYFKEYGEMWVRDIPRRIKSAMVRSKDLGIKTAEGNMAPIAHNVSDDGSLSIEAAFNGKLDNDESKVMITAEFNKEGRMKRFEATRIA